MTGCLDDMLYSYGRTTSNSSLVFCPFCGNKSMAKVMVTVDNDGTLHYQFLGQKQFSHRGLRVKTKKIERKESVRY